MTGIKKTIMTIAFCTVFVLAAVLFVPKTVFANGDQGEITRGAHYSTSEDHGEIQSDKPVKIDLDSAWTHWFKFTSSQKQVIQLDTTGDVDVKAYIYKGSQTGEIVAEPSEFLHEFNAHCVCLVDSGVYWIEISPEGLSTDTSANNTEVELTFLQRTKVASYDDEAFPDPVFRDYVEDNFDIWKDGQLTYDEMKLVISINVEDLGITDMTGICYFKELANLQCSKNKFATLTISDMPELMSIKCARSKEDMDSIVIDNCPKLISLECFEDYLSTLSLSGCDRLYYLSCNNNGRLKELDVSNMTCLNNLQCTNNTMTSLKFDGCTSLEYLYCYMNCLESLDVSGLPRLHTLDCSDSYFSTLTSLTLGNNDNLNVLKCYGNGINKLDISGCPRLIQTYEAGIQEEDEKTVTYGTNNAPGYIKMDKTVKINTIRPTATPTVTPLVDTTITPTAKPSVTASVNPSATPTAKPSAKPTIKPSAAPSGKPTANPSAKPSLKPTSKPTLKPTPKPSVKPTNKPTSRPTVKPTSKPVVSLTLNKSSIQLVCGKKDTLKATLKGSSSKLSWKSSDTSVATVDGSGKISAKKAGTVTITCSAAGKTANCKVTVLYKDVTNPKDFWFEPTNSLTAAGIVKGYDKQTKFKPANECTRAQMVTFIWRLQGEPNPKAKTCKFKDVKKTDYYYKACIWGNENHIVEGYKDGTFGPKIVCARRHAVTFLWRLAGKPAPKTTKNKFNDVKKTDYFYKATLWASEKGILAGYKDGTFRPNGNCLRRQMVTFLYKYDKFINVKKK